jgi:hypothetical protein
LVTLCSQEAVPCPRHKSHSPRIVLPEATFLSIFRENGEPGTDDLQGRSIRGNMTRHLKVIAIAVGIVLLLIASRLVPGAMQARKVYSSTGLINTKNSLHIVGTNYQVHTVILASMLPMVETSILPVQGHEDSVFNVKAYGAKGEGKTNDSPAFQRAYNAAVAAGGGTVFIPRSSSCYLLNTGISMTSTGTTGRPHVIIQGSTHGYGTGASPAAQICGNTGNVVFDVSGSGSISFKDLWVTSNSGVTNPSLIGILAARNSSNNGADNITVTDCIFDMVRHTRGTTYSFGAYLYGAELNYYTRDSFSADYPLVVSDTNDFGITSPFINLGKGSQSETQDSFTNMELDTSGLGNAAYFSGTWDMTLTGHSWNFNTVNSYPSGTLQPYALKFLRTNHAMFVKWRQEGFPGFLENNLSLYNSQIYGTNAPFPNASKDKHVHAVEFLDASSNIIHDTFAIEDEYPFTTPNNYYDSSEGTTSGVAILDDVDFSCGGETNCVNIPIGNYDPGYTTYWREVRWSGQANNQHPKINLGYAAGMTGPITGSFVIKSGTVVNANSCTSLKAQTGVGINTGDFYIRFNNRNIYHALLTADDISSGSFAPLLCNPTSSSITVRRNLTEYWKISRQ